jgi:hypothetical protein
MENLNKIYGDFNSKLLTYEEKNNFENKNDEQTIDIIHNNINNIANDKILAKEFFDLIYSHNLIVKECLTFDLLNYKPKNCEKINEIDKMVNFCNDTFNKYQYKVGGFSIEDESWFSADSSCKRFKVKENQKILYNSVNKKKCDKELIWFLDSILNYTKNFSDKIKISYNIFEDERNCICWIIFKFKQ